MTYAERLCREQLAKQETPAVWLALGELLSGDAARECFEAAWRVSGARFAPAQRALASAAIRDKRWADAVSHWELSLAINSLHADAWFSCGCALMQVFFSLFLITTQHIAHSILY